MSFLQLTSSSYSSNTFSIQNAAVAFAQPPTPFSDPTSTLYTQGCNIQETRNCTIACQDPTQIFMSPYTLQNCMVLSILAPSNWMQPNEPASPLSSWTQPLSTGALAIAIEFGINATSRDFPSLAFNVSQTINGCLEQYCLYNQNCRTNVTVQDNINATLVPFRPWYWKYTGYDSVSLIKSPVGYNMTCPFGSALNPDIGGIGVSHGYAPPMIKSPPELILE